MCGIIGWFDISGKTSEGDLRREAIRMADSIRHRGPDAEGYWIEAESGLAFGHRRLSIIDLSEAGAQPMISRTGRFVIVLNGEIYNFQILREELIGIGHSFRGTSDTEVLLAAIEEWGAEATLRKLIGMFAFALWDRQERCLFLARDRTGEKPLYWGLQKGRVFFASELKAISRHTQFERRVNQDALMRYLRFGYVPSELSIFESIQKLKPAHWVRFRAREGHLEIDGPHPYWSLEPILSGLSEDPGEQLAVESTERILTDAVGKQMVADVPLGAFLSGGVDSSLIVALMQKQSTRPVRTFSIGFEDKRYDESDFARSVAEHLGTEHTAYFATEKDAEDLIPQIPEYFDEPFADSSQIPTLLVSRIARKHVTVALSGDAGDELFAGYNRYFWLSSIWKKRSMLPNVAWRGVAGSLEAIAPHSWDRLFDSSIGKVLPNRFRVRLPGDKLHKLAAVLRDESPEAMYLSLVSHWKRPSEAMRNKSVARGSALATDTMKRFDHRSFTEAMMYHDFLTYLPDDILVKVDRAAMSNSLETRAPFLDHRVVEHAFRLPLKYKVRDGQSKWILRQILYRHVPQKLIERPKMGFGIPVEDWLRTRLRPWAEELLSKERLEEHGFLDTQTITNKWTEHVSGKRNWISPIWTVLMFQAWFKHHAASH